MRQSFIQALAEVHCYLYHLTHNQTMKAICVYLVGQLCLDILSDVRESRGGYSFTDWPLFVAAFFFYLRMFKCTVATSERHLIYASCIISVYVKPNLRICSIVWAAVL